MEGQSSASNSQYQYQWQRLVRRNTVADSTAPPFSSLAGSPQIQTQLDLLPILLPQHESYHQAQLAHYNRLLASSTSISSSNRTPSGLQTSPLPPLLSPHHIQAVPRSRSTSRGGNTVKSNKSTSRIGHGNKESRKGSKGERALITEREASATMPVGKLDLTGQLPNRPLAQHQNSSLSHQSSSVPSTPHQHARKFSFDREPSPNATNNPSPRSAYSESHIALPARPAPPPRGNCRYETAGNKFMRRMPYSIGNEKLEDKNVADIKSRLSDDEERRLSADMRELYGRLLPTSQSETRREELVKKLETLFNEEWPGHDIRVHVFGSSGNLLCTDDSDVDICITTDWREMESVCQIAELLAKNGMQNVVCVSYAKVPIVKIWDPKLQLACDMNVNNTLALENTRMVKTYIQVDPRVRPLAMIIKHWTKRRIINDAAFGGTLSSYTWICMIINFLQTRANPVLPNLHRRPQSRGSEGRTNGSSFMDDVASLQDFGNRNKESLGDLLFGFFRFYGYEFDYENLVVSVRNGAHVSKVEKGWHLATNNRLCVEEPFNIGRNLANTADDFSWRGLHLELRRAFELVSEVKLEECCEQYTIPKVQVSGNTFEKPTQSKKPVLRSASQSNRGGRGNHRGGRHNNQQNRNASGSRRASSGQFDGAIGYIPGMLPSNMSVHEAWLQRQAQAQLHNDLYATYSVLQAQENNLRLQLYNQSQQYLQAQNQAFAQSQVQSQGSASGKQQSDRNRTSSFDQPPLSAPIRPQDMYYYPLQYQPTPMYGYQTPSTNPSSPSLSHAVPDNRRGVHRSSVTNGSNNVGNNSSSLRSHSQPASRPNTSQLHMQGPGIPNPGLGSYQPSRHMNVMPVPNFIADENVDSLVDTASLNTTSSSPDDLTPKEYVGYYVSDAALNPAYRQSLMPMPIPSFGDLKQGRRLSTEKLPQSVRDRLQRPSRSPSPLGHDRSYSTNTFPPPGNPIPIRQSVSSTNLQALNIQAPAIVNGSNVSAPISIPQWQATMCARSPEDENIPEIGSTSLASSSNFSTIGSDLSKEQAISGQSTPRQDTPLVVNGSNPSASQSVSPEQLPTGMIPIQQSASQNARAANDYSPSNTTLRSSPNTNSRLSRQMQNGGVSPLDIGLSQNEVPRADYSHLSPVYETHTPSPRTSRKLELVAEKKSNGTTSKAPSELPPAVSTSQKIQSSSQSKQNLQPAKTNGHLRGSKSEGGNSSNVWQKAGSKKKKGTPVEPASSGDGQPLSEKLPRKDSERRGG